MQIRKGDTVEVVTGNDRGVRGKVMRVIPKKERVVVAGANVVKKHQRAVQAGRGQVQPGIIEFEAPIHVSKVMLVCPQCSRRTRVGYIILEDGRKVRRCKACEQAME